MTRQRTINVPQPQQSKEENPSELGSDSPLLESVNAWAEVAEQARSDIEQGADAERELLRRRNGPGQ